MKTYALAGLACLCLLFSFTSDLNAQICIPDPQYTAPGIYPDSATGFAPATQCTYYEQLITNIVPPDTTSSGITCTIDSVVLDSVVGLPPGLTYACSTPTCSFPGGTTGCALVYGTPTDTGTYPITAATTAYLSGGFFCGLFSPSVNNITYYTIVVTSSITFTVTDPSCGGTCDGQITATTNGPPAPYTYLWNDGQTTATAVGLCAGTYSVTVTDSAGCASINSVTINGASSMANTFTTVSETCYGGCDATATAVVTGGTPPFSYVWSDSLAQTNTTATGLCAGAYGVTITDGSGCNLVDSVSINGLFPYDVAVVPTDASSYGTCDGSATAVLIGGTPAFTYAWDNGQTTSSISGLCAGVYCVTVTDNIGCTAIHCDTVGQPSPPSIGLTTSSFDASCNGSCDGVATVSVTGGVPPYIPQWNNGQTTFTAIGLCAGTYVVLVTDSLGATATDTVTIGEPPLFSIDSMVTTQASSYGACDGTATPLVLSGNPPYTYLWDDPLAQTNSTATGLCAGTWCVTVTDNNNCLTTNCDSVGQPPPPPIVTATAGSDASCNGICDGSAVVTATGGVPPYNYLWNDPSSQTNATVTGLCAGSYLVVITDALGATATDSVTIGEPASIVATYVPVSSSCGNADGSACLTATGGAGGYSYLWDNGANTSCASGLLSGSYLVTITDQDSCSTTITVLINDAGGPIIDSIVVMDLSCYGDSSGSAMAHVSSGAAPLTYTWQDDMANVIGSNNIAVSNLWGGTFTFTVTDNNGCLASSSFTVIEPAVLSATAGSSPSSCTSCDGTASVTVTGGTGSYGYIWSDVNTQSTATATGLCSGIYICSIYDQNGCVTSELSTVGSLNAPLVTYSVTDASCNGVCDGSAILNTTGGNAPYTYSWSSGNTTSSATNLCAGGDTITVADSAGCDTTVSIMINEPSALTITSSSTNATCGQCTGTATAVVSGGTLPYSYLWDDPASQTNTTATGLCPMAYYPVITDANGCLDWDSILVGSSSTPVGSLTANNISCNGICDGTASVTMIGGISPYTYAWSNGDSSSTVAGLCSGSYDVTVYDNTGCDTIMVFSITEPANLAATHSFTDASCNAACDGTADIIATGGTAPYTCTWPTGGTSFSDSSLCAGSYNVTITDLNGCTTTTTVVISEPPALVLNESFTEVTCNGLCDGTGLVTVTGGLSPYTYLWSNGVNVANVSNLCAGTYSVTVSDFSGCNDSTFITVPEPLPISMTTLVTDVSCNGLCDGSVMTMVAGGFPPYSYLWSGGTTGSGISAQCADSGFVQVTDSMGCNGLNTYLINEPAALVSAVTTTDESAVGASDGTATVSISGGIGPYMYSWDTSPMQTTATAVGLTAGSYIATVTDSSGCIISDTAVVDVFVGIMDGQLVEISVYPNPATTELQISNSFSSMVSIVVFDGIGKQKKFLHLKSGISIIDLTNFSNGMYVYQLQDIEGKVIGQGKFIVKR